MASGSSASKVVPETKQIETLADLEQRRADIWAYLTERFLTFREFDDSNTARRSIQPWWKVVQGAARGGDSRTITRRNPKTKPEISRLLSMFLGYLTSIAARLQVSDPWVLWNVMWEYAEPYLNSPKFKEKYYAIRFNLVLIPMIATERNPIMNRLSKSEVEKLLSYGAGLEIIAECAAAFGVNIERREYRRRFIREIMKQGFVESEYFPESDNYRIQVLIPIGAQRETRDVSKRQRQFLNLTTFRTEALVVQRRRAA